MIVIIVIFFLKMIINICAGERALCTNESCSLKFVDVKCDSRRRHFRHLGSDQRSQQLMSAEFEMNVKPTNPTGPYFNVQHREAYCTEMDSRLTLDAAD